MTVKLSTPSQHSAGWQTWVLFQQAPGCAGHHLKAQSALQVNVTLLWKYAATWGYSAAVSPRALPRMNKHKPFWGLEADGTTEQGRETLLYAKRKSSTLLCSCIFIALQTQSSFRRSPARSIFWPSASWVSFIASPSRLCFQGCNFPAISLDHRSLPAFPVAFPACQRVSPASCPSQGWHMGSALSERSNPVRRVLPGAAGQRPLLPARGRGKVFRTSLVSCRFLPAHAATSWASTGTGFLREIATPKCKELGTVDILLWWSKETATLRVPGLGRLKCRDDRVVQLLKWLVLSIFP